MSGWFGGRSPRHKHSWRQKGTAAVVAGGLLIPVVDGFVQDTMPNGIVHYVRSLHAPDVTSGGSSNPVPMPEPTAQAPHPSSLESIVSENDVLEASPDVAYKLATGVVSLGEEALETYERVAHERGIEDAKLLAILIIESDGGRLPVPRAYLGEVPGGQSATSAPSHVPFGQHHVKMRDLNGILDQAAEARKFYSRFGEDVLESIEELGWSASTDVSSVLSEEQLATALAYFHGESGMRRMAGLAATVPDVEISDLRDPEESALAASVIDAYTVHHLTSLDIPLDDRARLLAYTGGPIGTARALDGDHATLSDNEFDVYAQEVGGNWAQWYVSAGREVLGLVREHGFDRIYDVASQLESYRAENGGFENDTLGALYLGELERPGHIRAFENFRESVPSVADPDAAYETFVSLGSPDTFYANR